MGAGERQRVPRLGVRLSTSPLMALRLAHPQPLRLAVTVPHTDPSINRAAMAALAVRGAIREDRSLNRSHPFGHPPIVGEEVLRHPKDAVCHVRRREDVDRVMYVREEHGDAETDGERDVRIAPEFFFPHGERHQEGESGVAGKEESRFKPEAGVGPVEDAGGIGADLAGIDADVRSQG